MSEEINNANKNLADKAVTQASAIEETTATMEEISSAIFSNVQLATFVTVMVWGFTILDAAVDAHIRPFDVSDNLSMQIKPSIHQFQQENYFALSVNLNLK